MQIIALLEKVNLSVDRTLTWTLTVMLLCDSRYVGSESDSKVNKLYVNVANNKL